MRVLVVDDESSVRAFVSESLGARMEIVGASTGPEALELLRSETFDCVVLDIVMPGMTGLEVLEEIRSDLDLVDVRVIILTGRASEDDHLNAYQGGADGYVTKPFEEDALEAVVRAVVERPADERVRHRKEEIRRAELLHHIEDSFGL